MSPSNAVYRSNRAAALIALGRLGDAIRECEDALKAAPTFARAHQRLACLYIRIGNIDSALRHMFATQFKDSSELNKLQTIQKHLKACADARRDRDWMIALREGDAAILAGADSSPLVFAAKAEALLKLHQLVEAESVMSDIPKLEPSPPCSHTKFCGILFDSYPFLVKAQIEMSLGRFENAVATAEKAVQNDPLNGEVVAVLKITRLVAGAYKQGKNLFNAHNFSEAYIAYGEGLKFDTSNPVLYCHRAACSFKLRQWERVVEDCDKALRVQPNCIEALLNHADSCFKLERWFDALKDYEALAKELPHDKEIAAALFHAQVALKKSLGEDNQNMTFRGVVEEISSAEFLRAAVSFPGVSLVYFMVASNTQCEEISPFVDTLCLRYQSLNFLKVNMEKCPAVAEAENVQIAPTFKIYKNGTRIKEMVCPSQQTLEFSLRPYTHY